MLLFRGMTGTFAAPVGASSMGQGQPPMSLKDTLTCLGCLLLLYPIAFVIYCIVALLKIYGPLLLLVTSLIYTPYMLIRSWLKKR